MLREINVKITLRKKKVCGIQPVVLNTKNINNM